MLGQLADRVNGLGGDDSEIGPSPDGTDPSVGGAQSPKCITLQGLTIGLTALLAVLFGVVTGASAVLWPVVVVVLLALTILVWFSACRPTLCRLLVTLASGALVASAALALVVLVGWGSAASGVALAWTAIVGFALSILAVARGCYRASP